MVVVPTSYEGSDEEEELEMVSLNNQTNSNDYNLVNDFESKYDNEENFLMKMSTKKQKHSPRPPPKKN